METSCGYTPVLDWLRTMAGETVWVITHEAPDGDAIGSLLAAYELLAQLGAKPVALCADQSPQIYRFLPGLERVRQSVPPASQGSVPGALLYVDCGDAARAGALAGDLPVGSRVVNIDHHRSNSAFGDLNWVDTSYSSTCEMLATLFIAAGIAFGVARDALYTGIVTDTGSFAYEGTSARTHRVAAELVAAGASPSQLFDEIYNTRDPAALSLLGVAIASLRLAAGGRIAVMLIRPTDFERTGAKREHAEGIVNYARSLCGVQVGVLLYSVEPGLVRGSIRTRPGVPADRIAAAFGGGGHPRAAGFRMAGDLEGALGQVLAEAGRHLIEL